MKTKRGNSKRKTRKVNTVNADQLFEFHGQKLKVEFISNKTLALANFNPHTGMLFSAAGVI